MLPPHHSESSVREHMFQSFSRFQGAFCYEPYRKEKTRIKDKASSLHSQIPLIPKILHSDKNTIDIGQ